MLGLLSSLIPKEPPVNLAGFGVGSPVSGGKGPGRGLGWGGGTLFGMEEAAWRARLQLQCARAEDV